MAETTRRPAPPYSEGDVGALHAALDELEWLLRRLPGPGEPMARVARANAGLRSGRRAREDAAEALVIVWELLDHGETPLERVQDAIAAAGLGELAMLFREHLERRRAGLQRPEEVLRG